MPKPFDATTKSLLEAGPEAWLALAGLAADGALSPLDTDLSTVTTAADGVFRVAGPAPWLAHFELQSSRDAKLGFRLLRYNVLLAERHDLPVQSVLVLLRPQADAPDLTGVYERRFVDGRPYLKFHYAVVRVWELSAAALLRGGLATLPLAPIANLEGTALPSVLRVMDERLRAEAPRGLARTYATAAAVLMGLRYPPDFLKTFLRGGREMDFWRDSSIVQMVMDEGRAEGLAEGLARGEARGEARILLKLGGKRFGAASDATAAAIQAIADVPRLEQLLDRLDDVAGWDELLATPPPDLPGAGD